jgi:WD40 repeat protein
MNTLEELNAHSRTFVSITDDRPAGVTLDRAKPYAFQFNENQVFISYDGTPWYIEWDIAEIEEIPNWETAKCYFLVEVFSDDVGLYGSTGIFFDVIPGGVTEPYTELVSVIENESTNLPVGRVGVKVQYFKTKEEWIQFGRGNFTWEQPSINELNTSLIYYVRVSLNWTDAETNTQQRIRFEVFDPEWYYDVYMESEFTFVGNFNQTKSGQANLVSTTSLTSSSSGRLFTSANLTSTVTITAQLENRDTEIDMFAISSLNASADIIKAQYFAVWQETSLDYKVHVFYSSLTSAAKIQEIDHGYFLRRAVNWTDQGNQLIIGGQSNNTVISEPPILLREYNRTGNILSLSITKTLHHAWAGWDIEYSPDNQTIAYGTTATTNPVFLKRDGSTFTQLTSQPYTEVSTETAAWAPSGNWAVFGRYLSTTGLRFYTRSGDVMTAWTPTIPFSPAARSIDVHPTSTTMAIGTTTAIVVWNLSGSTWTSVLSFTTAPDFGYTVSWSPDGNYLAAAVGNSSTPLRIWYRQNATTFVPVTVPNNITVGAGTGVSWKSDGKVLAVTGASNDFINLFTVSGSESNLTFTKQTTPSIPSLQSTKNTFVRFNR